jgi:hypothetical protein
MIASKSLRFDRGEPSISFAFKSHRQERAYATYRFSTRQGTKPVSCGMKPFGFGKNPENHFLKGVESANLIFSITGLGMTHC